MISVAELECGFCMKTCYGPGFCACGCHPDTNTTEIEVLKAELEALKREYAEEYEAWKEEKEQLLITIGRYEEEIKDLNEDVSKAENEAWEARSDVTSYQSQVNDLEYDAEGLRKERDNLQDRLEDYIGFEDPRHD